MKDKRYLVVSPLSLKYTILLLKSSTQKLNYFVFKIVQGTVILIFYIFHFYYNSQPIKFKHSYIVNKNKALFN